MDDKQNSKGGVFIRPGLKFDDGNLLVKSNDKNMMLVGVPGPNDTTEWLSPMQVKKGFPPVR